MEYVIRGNAAVLKCSIPSFVADFVRVESWIDEREPSYAPLRIMVFSRNIKPFQLQHLVGVSILSISHLHLFLNPSVFAHFYSCQSVL